MRSAGRVPEHPSLTGCRGLVEDETQHQSGNETDRSMNHGRVRPAVSMKKRIRQRDARTGREPLPGGLPPDVLAGSYFGAVRPRRQRGRQRVSASRRGRRPLLIPWRRSWHPWILKTRVCAIRPRTQIADGRGHDPFVEPVEEGQSVGIDAKVAGDDTGGRVCKADKIPSAHA